MSLTFGVDYDLRRKPYQEGSFIGIKPLLNAVAFTTVDGDSIAVMLFRECHNL